MRRALALRATLAILVAGAACLTALASPAGALIRPVGADFLARAARTIVLATATDAHSYQSVDPASASALGGAIVTDVRLRVHKVLKGSAPTQMTITIPGGRVGNLGLTCPDAPSFQRGHRYLVYLDSGGQIVAWRRGQPEVIGGRLPSLGVSLKQVERRVATLTGQPAKTYAAESPAGGGSATTDTPAYLVLAPSALSAAETRRSAPLITSVTPNAASAGTETVVTITGSGFGATQGAAKVDFFYQQDSQGDVTLIEAPVVSWTDTAIACVVPTDTIDDYPASAGTGPVHVWLNPQDPSTFSTGFPFFVTYSYGGLQWPKNKCQYRVNGSGNADWEAAVRQAAATWTAVGAGGFSFIDGGQAPSGITAPVQNGYNDISWAPLSDASVIASAWTYDIGRAIMETDIVFNTVFQWSTSGGATEMDVETIALHELGHWLNLRDLYGPPGLNAAGDLGDTAKVMYGFADNGTVKRSPDVADTAGIQWVYSAQRRDTKRPTSTVAKRESVRRFRTVDLSLLVKDPEYSCGAATIRIVIRDGSGRVVLRILGWGAPTNEWSYIPFKCKLPRGVYRWQVLATDMTGRRQIKAGSAKLVVR
jgi:hypothetical protein